MRYFIRTPWYIKKIFSQLTWDIPTNEKKIYLSFDDGPHPVATPFVLDQLKKYNAKATFFCIGKNVVDQPALYSRLLDEGHRAANHTHNHLNGRNVSDKEYFDNILEASKHIDSKMFRPPYGRMKIFQRTNLLKAGWKIIMWDVLSADFDINCTPERCAENVILNARPGSIVVFHDSEKAYNRLQYALPRVLEHFTQKGFSFDLINPVS